MSSLHSFSEGHDHIVNAREPRSTESVWQNVRESVLLGMFFGVATGAAEACVRLFASVAFGRSFNDVGPDMVWMIPAADLIMFSALGLVIGLVGAGWRGERLRRIGLIALSALAAYTVPLHYVRIHDVARIVLATGIGVQVGGFLSRRSDGLRSLRRKVTWPAIALVILTGFAFRGKDLLAERRALATLPQPPTSAPNILVVILDAVRASDLSVYGYARRTSPNLERLAMSAVVFDRAIPTAPWSLPSHASMFTGRYPHEMSADWEVPLDARYPTLAELLRDRGYVTGGFVANYYYGMAGYGLSRGFVHYESRRWRIGQVLQSSKLGAYLIDRFNGVTHSYYSPARRNAAEMNRRLLEWLPERGRRPFFAFVNYFDAHDPYVAPAEYARRFLRAEPATRMGSGRRLGSEEVRGMRDAYDGAIAYLDDQLAILLRAMDKSGDLANTIVIITSDHGEEFGEHGWVNHGNSLYYASLHIPLLVFFPGRVPGGVRVSEGVTLRDLPATAIDLVGFGDSVMVPGRSWAAHWSARPDSSRAQPSPLLSELKRPRDPPPWYAIAKGDMQSIIVGQHHYIRNGDGREELFDVVADPWETTDLASHADLRATLDTTRAALASARAKGTPTSATNSPK